MVTIPSITGRYRFFAVAAIGTFIGTLEGSILNVALPTIASDLGVEIDIVAWVVLAYQLTVVSVLMAFGAWAGRKGYAFAYRFGFVFLLIGSVLCALAGSIELLIVGRIVQALGGAMFQAVGMGLITTVFPPEERGKGIGLMAMMVALGLMTGPPLGGFMLSHFSWQSIFILVIPVGLVGLGMTTIVFRRFTSPLTKRKINLSNAVFLSLALVCGMLALTSIDSDGQLGGKFLWLVAISFIALILFVRAESQPEKAMIGAEIFRSGQLRISLATMFLMFAAIAGALILIPFYLQDILDYSPMTVGLFLTIIPVTMLVFAPISGRISDRIGFRLLTVVGMMAVSVSLYCLSRIDEFGSDEYLIMSLTILGIGVGLFNTPNSSAMMGSVNTSQRPVASSILSSTRNVGWAVGVALATALHSAVTVGPDLTEQQIFVARYQAVIYVCIVFALVGALLCLFRKNRPANFGKAVRQD